MIKKSFIIILFLFLIFPGCTKKEEVKPSADYLLTTEAIDTIDLLKTAYLQKRSASLRKRSAPAVAEPIVNELSFDKAELSITPRMVSIRESTVVVNTSWQGTWAVQMKRVKNRGIADFVFEGSPMMLIRIDGDNPFRNPLIQ